MYKLTSIKIKYQDDTYSDQIPISVLAENVEWDNTSNLIDIIGSVDLNVNGSIQEQISKLFAEKVSNTDLSDYVENSISQDVTSWLNQNVNPAGSAVVVDQSLSVAGAAADSKKTGDEISSVRDSLGAITEEVQSVNFFSGYTENGGINNTSGAETTSTAYVRTGYIPIDASKGTLYILRTTSPWGMRVFFYDETKTFISPNTQIFNGSTTILTGSTSIPSNAVYVRTYRDATATGNVEFSYTQESEYTPYQGGIMLKDGIVNESNFSQELSEKINGSLYGKTVVFMGDSIVGNFYQESGDNIGICNIIAQKTGANVLNCAFGGTRMAYRYGDNVQYTYWNYFSGLDISQSIKDTASTNPTVVANAWKNQIDCLTGDPRPFINALSYFKARIEMMEDIDWSEVDYIFWEYGTNDFSTDVMVSDSEHINNYYAFDNAYRKAIENIQSAYPNIQIVPITPIWKWWNNGSTFLYDSNTHPEKDYDGNLRYLTDFVSKTQEIAREYQLPCIDDYYSLGASELTRGSYFDSTEGTHPNANGRKRIADHILAQFFAGTQSVRQEKIDRLAPEWTLANLFDIRSANFNHRLYNDGTIDTVAQFLISEWISIEKRDTNTIRFSSAPHVIEIADESKTNIAFLSSKTQVDLNDYPSAKYIRFSCDCTTALNMVVTDHSVNDFVDYGYTIDRPVADADVNKQIAQWSHANSDSVENILLDSEYTFYKCCGYKDYSIVKDSEYAIVLPSSAGENVELRLTKSNAVNLIGVQKIVLKFWLENANNVSSVGFSITGTSTYSNVKSSGLTNGWNEVTCFTSQNDTLSAETWSTATNFRIYFQGTGVFTAKVSAINFHRAEKGKLIFVDDHSYHGFKTIAYPLLKAVGQPVTWAINPGRLGAEIGNPPYESILSQEDINELAYDAYSEFSFHNWNPQSNPTETMTPDELRQDYHKCITYLRKNGICPTHIWRAALTQNRADNWWVAQDMVEAAAVHTAAAGFAVWPFYDRYNVARFTLHGRPFHYSPDNTTLSVDELFERVRLTHCTMILYTHGCVEDDVDVHGQPHAHRSEIEYCCRKIWEGATNGWLEPTTYNRLRVMEEHGMYTLSPSSYSYPEPEDPEATNES